MRETAGPRWLQPRPDSVDIGANGWVVARNELRRRSRVLTIIESGSQIWALAASDGDLHIYSREDVGDWTEVLLSEDSEQIDQDGSAILEALYEQYAMRNQDGQAAASEAEEEEPVDEEEEPVDEEEVP